jgi:HSP20 family protein
MKVSRFNPGTSNRLGLNHWVDDFFNRGVSDFFSADFVLSRPSVNISETTEGWMLELAAPGLEKSDFEIKLEGDAIVVSAKKSSDIEEKNDNYTRREFNFSSFSRSFQLPKEVEVSKISAQYENGVLHLLLPKAIKEEIQNSTRIEIK